MLWINWYLIYETNLSVARSRLVGSRINMSFMPFSVNFLSFCILSMILAFLIRLIIRFFFQKYEQLFSSWLLTGVTLITVNNLLLSSTGFAIDRKDVGYGWLCCVDDSSGYLQWLMTLLLIVIYTILFVFAKKHIVRKPESFK
jgi:H+/Cl- antiporter ClcA